MLNCLLCAAFIKSCSVIIAYLYKGEEKTERKKKRDTKVKKEKSNNNSIGSFSYYYS